MSMDGAMTKSPSGRGEKPAPTPLTAAKAGSSDSLLTEAQGIPVVPG